MRNILVLGAGKSATTLIETLLSDAVNEHWIVHIADLHQEMASQKIAGHPHGRAHAINLDNQDQLSTLIQQMDAVISMLPPPLHTRIALSCLQNRKHFLNASYLTDELRQLHPETAAAGLSFLCEMGLDPGIDHMSAMEMIHDIQSRGGKITSFRSHCGGLIAPESDDNPWHYKISWNPRNIILAGKDGARFLENGRENTLSYLQLFDPSRTIDIPGYGQYSWYPNRDSFPYIALYGLSDVRNFVRTTLRHPDFARGWRFIVESGLTDTQTKLDTEKLTYDAFFKKFIPHSAHLDNTLHQQIQFLAPNRNIPIAIGVVTPAEILQHILENKLALSPNDRDMIIMLHEIGFMTSNGYREKKAHLVVKGEDALHTAMSKTVGLPLAIAVKLILNGKISRKGVFIPIYEDVYRPVLHALENYGLSFTTSEEGAPSSP